MSENKKGMLYSFATLAARTERVQLCHPRKLPLAFVGSELDNGDTITDSPERKAEASRRFVNTRNEK
jgi:hypothetical protein